MSRFKVGDVVVAKESADELYTITRTSMEKAVVTSVINGCMFIKPIGGSDNYFVHQDDFKKVEDKIIIYRDGQNVIALDVDSKKKAVAKCSPDDEFDFKTGAKIAFSRLVGNYDGKDNIQVGDYVKLFDKREVYNTYKKWNYLVGYEGNFVEGSDPKYGVVYKVLRIGKHNSNNNDIALIQNPETTQVFIIGINGIRKAE